MKSLALIQHLLAAAVVVDGEKVSDRDLCWIEWARGASHLNYLHLEQAWRIILQHLDTCELAAATREFESLNSDSIS